MDITEFDYQEKIISKFLPLSRNKEDLPKSTQEQMDSWTEHGWFFVGNQIAEGFTYYVLSAGQRDDIQFRVIIHISEISDIYFVLSLSKGYRGIHTWDNTLGGGRQIARDLYVQERYRAILSKIDLREMPLFIAKCLNAGHIIGSHERAYD